MKVLIATDGSEQSTIALRTAGRILRASSAEVDLLCVASPLSLPRQKSGKPKAETHKLQREYEEKIKTETEKILAGARDLLKESGIEAGTITEFGSPAGVIVQKAFDYDLTVVGAHDRYQRSKPGLGHVASRVVAGAANSVLVARDLVAEKGMRILIGVDGSLASQQAIRLMAEYFRADVADITLLQVVETPWIHLGLEQEWFDYRGRIFERVDPETQIDREMHFEAEDVIEVARGILESNGLGSDTMIAEGDPALEILGEAESGQYDLIVLGATGGTGLKHDMLGSVSTKVARDAPCSVFIVKFME